MDQEQAFIRMLAEHQNDLNKVRKELERLQELHYELEYLFDQSSSEEEDSEEDSSDNQNSE